MVAALAAGVQIPQEHLSQAAGKAPGLGSAAAAGAAQIGLEGRKLNQRNTEAEESADIAAAAALAAAAVDNSKLRGSGGQSSGGEGKKDVADSLVNPHRRLQQRIQQRLQERLKEVKSLPPNDSPAGALADSPSMVDLLDQEDSSSADEHDDAEEDEDEESQKARRGRKEGARRVRRGKSAEGVEASEDAVGRLRPRRELEAKTEEASVSKPKARGGARGGGDAGAEGGSGGGDAQRARGREAAGAKERNKAPDTPRARERRGGGGGGEGGKGGKGDDVGSPVGSPKVQGGARGKRARCIDEKMDKCDDEVFVSWRLS
jgi:hypothetical protein